MSERQVRSGCGVCVWWWARLYVLLPEDPLVMVGGLAARSPVLGWSGSGVTSCKQVRDSAPWTANRQIAGGPQCGSDFWEEEPRREKRAMAEQTGVSGEAERGSTRRGCDAGGCGRAGKQKGRPAGG